MVVSSVELDKQIDDWYEEFPSSASRDATVLKDQVLDQLRRIIDPDLHRDIVSLGFVKDLKINYDDQSIAFTLELTTPACPVKDKFVEDATQYLHELGWVQEVSVNLTSRDPSLNRPLRGPPVSANLVGVANIIAVASCKGGVGKSTIACNLAYMLAKMGARVGLVDVDIYGPSLPFLLPFADQRVYFTQPERHKRQGSSLTFEHSVALDESHNAAAETCCTQGEDDEVDPEAIAKENLQKALTSGSGGLIPLQHNNVKLMSYGYLKSSDHAPLRGPMASTIAFQMVAHTFWGELDYLLIDFPPGTGDVHLTLAQSFPIHASIIVSTPQELSVVDVDRGLAFFNSLKIRTVALVENMSFFTCPTCHTSHSVFARGQHQLEALVERYSIPLVERISLHQDMATLVFPDQRITSQSDQSMIFPFVAAFDDSHPMWHSFSSLAANLVREIAMANYMQHRPPLLRFGRDKRLELVIFSAPTADAVVEEAVFDASPRDIRLQCRCAECVDEFTGRSRVVSRKVPSDLTASALRPSGNYAMCIEWSDGHESLMPFTLLEKMFRDIVAAQRIQSPAPSCLSSNKDVDW